MSRVGNGFEYGYGAYFGRQAAKGTVGLALLALDAWFNRLQGTCEFHDVAGEHLALTTMSRRGRVIGSGLYRVVDGRNEPLAGYDSREAALAGLAQWVHYLENGGTMAAWREHNAADAERFAARVERDRAFIAARAAGTPMKAVGCGWAATHTKAGIITARGPR